MTIEVRDSREPGHFWADNELVDKYLPDIGVHAFAVYILLARYANNQTGQAMPSIGGMADRLGMSKPTVRKALAVLVDCQLISVQARAVVRGEKGNTVQIPNVYTLLRVKGGGKGDLPPLVKDIDQGGKGRLPGVVKDVYPNKTHVEKTQLTKKDDGETANGGGANDPRVEGLMAAGLTYRQACLIVGTHPDMTEKDVADSLTFTQRSTADRPAAVLFNSLKAGIVPPIPPQRSTTHA